LRTGRKMPAFETDQRRQRMPIDLDETAANISRRETTTVGDGRHAIAPEL
jgi:hypothetical protein